MAQDRVRRTDAELIGIAKAVQRPPIDVVVVYSIYASSEELAYITKVRARISGRMINVKSGQRLGAFEVESPKEWTAPKDCNRECILEVVGKYSRVLGQDLGAQISVKLDDMVTGGPSGGLAKKGDIGSAYTIVFQGFAREEIQTFEEYLAVFAGYKNHRPIYAGPRHAEIWYESTAPSARLTRNIGKMLDNEGIRGTVNFSGSEVTVTKLTERKKRAINQSDFQ